MLNILWTVWSVVVMSFIVFLALSFMFTQDTRGKGE